MVILDAENDEGWVMSTGESLTAIASNFPSTLAHGGAILDTYLFVMDEDGTIYNSAVNAAETELEFSTFAATAAAISANDFESTASDVQQIILDIQDSRLFFATRVQLQIEDAGLPDGFYAVWADQNPDRNGLYKNVSGISTKYSYGDEATIRSIQVLNEIQDTVTQNAVKYTPILNSVITVAAGGIDDNGGLKIPLGSTGDGS